MLPVYLYQQNRQAMISKVNTLAAQIRKSQPGTTRSESMRKAWATIKAAPAAQTLSFTKKDGTKTVRIVATNWFDFQPPVGGKSNVQPGQILFADLCKVAIGESRVIISTYTHNIIALA